MQEMLQIAEDYATGNSSFAKEPGKHARSTIESSDLVQFDRRSDFIEWRTLVLAGAHANKALIKFEEAARAAERAAEVARQKVCDEEEAFRQATINERNSRRRAFALSTTGDSLSWAAELKVADVFSESREEARCRANTARLELDVVAHEWSVAQMHSSKKAQEVVWSVVEEAMKLLGRLESFDSAEEDHRRLLAENMPL